MTNSSCLAEAFNKKCKHDHEHGSIIGGNRSKLSQIYPPKLCKTIVRVFIQQLLEDNRRCGVDTIEGSNVEHDHHDSPDIPPSSLGSGRRVDCAIESDVADIALDTQPTRLSTASAYSKQATTCIKTGSQDTLLGETNP